MCPNIKQKMLSKFPYNSDSEFYERLTSLFGADGRRYMFNPLAHIIFEPMVANWRRDLDIKIQTFASCFKQKTQIG